MLVEFWGGMHLVNPLPLQHSLPLLAGYGRNPILEARIPCLHHRRLDLARHLVEVLCK